MTGLIDRYAADLLRCAREENLLEDFYTHALILTQRTNWSNIPPIPNKLDSFLRLVPPADLKAVLSKFIDISGEHLGLLDATVISAVPLTDRQQDDLENKLIRIFNKQIHIIIKIDPTLLGGIRIIAGHTVIDNTIKKKLLELKKNIYKGVYFK